MSIDASRVRIGGCLALVICYGTCTQSPLRLRVFTRRGFLRDVANWVASAAPLYSEPGHSGGQNQRGKASSETGNRRVDLLCIA